MSRLITVREAARLLDVHENTVRNWERASLLHAVRLPNSQFRRFDEEEVLELRRRYLHELVLPPQDREPEDAPQLVRNPVEGEPPSTPELVLKRVEDDRRSSGDAALERKNSAVAEEPLDAEKKPTVRHGVGVMAPYRRGILYHVTRCLVDLNCNIEDMVNSVRHGYFGLMLVCEAPEGTSRKSMRAALKAALQGDRPLQVDVWEVRESGRQPRSNHNLAVYGPDQPGVVNRIVAFLDECEIEYSDVVCNKLTDKSSQVAQCVCTLELNLPIDLTTVELSDQLDRVCKDLNAQVILTPFE